MKAKSMKQSLCGVALALLAACVPEAKAPVDVAAPEAPVASAAKYLFVWSDDKDKADSDFPSVVDLREGY